MTKKVKTLIISVLFVVVAVCLGVFAGCKVKYTVEELKEKYGLTSQITYFLNNDGGSFNGSYVKNLYYKTGAMPMDLGNTGLISGSSEMTIKSGNNFSGWYYVELDNNGNPLYAPDENNVQKVYSEDEEYDITIGMSMTDTKFDFSKPMEEGQHIYLCGNFYGDVKIELHLLCEEFGGEFNQMQYTNNGETVTVEDGGIIDYGCLNIPKTGGVQNYSSALQTRFTGYTVVDFYEKDENTDKYTLFTGWPIKYPEPDADGSYSNVVLYLKVLDGDWDVISSYSDLNKMFAVGNARKSYYIKQDIDCDGKIVKNQLSFSGVLYGGEEGHTIKNMVVQTSSTNTEITNGINNNYSIFGEITGTAKMENVTFENVTVNFHVGRNGDPDICFIANSIADGASIKNISVSGSLNVVLKYSNSHATNTMEDSWLFGDKDDGTYDGISVPYATCTITDYTGEKTVYSVGNKNETEDLQ